MPNRKGPLRRIRALIALRFRSAVRLRLLVLACPCLLLAALQIGAQRLGKTLVARRLLDAARRGEVRSFAPVRHRARRLERPAFLVNRRGLVYFRAPRKTLMG